LCLITGVDVFTSEESLFVDRTFGWRHDFGCDFYADFEVFPWDGFWVILADYPFFWLALGF
jgi:hypothetical protein